MSGVNSQCRKPESHSSDTFVIQVLTIIDDDIRREKRMMTGIASLYIQSDSIARDERNQKKRAGGFGFHGLGFEIAQHFPDALNRDGGQVGSALAKCCSTLRGASRQPQRPSAGLLQLGCHPIRHFWGHDAGEFALSLFS